LDNQIIGEAFANLFRADLAEAGLGDGKCGFVVEFYREIDLIYVPFVIVKIAGGDAELPRHASSGFQSFFNSLFVRYPSSGRSRCALGGLWTDRFDARALLRGKVAIGQIPGADRGPLERLIADGYTILDSIKNLDGSDARQHAADVLSEPSILSLLRRVFDDQPIALSTKMMQGSDLRFVQPSALEVLPSPGECVLVIASLDLNVAIDIVRKSHEFEEFTASGQSRWVVGGVDAAIEIALGQQGLIDREALGPRMAAVIGPGLLARVQAPAMSRCAPLRHGLSKGTNDAEYQDAIGVFS
jgi:hypothetical protein